MHVALRPFDLANTSHLELMYEVRCHPEVDRYLSGEPPQDYGQHLNYLEKSSKLKKYYVIIADDQLCGYCQATPSAHTIELGFALHPDWWGRGIGKQSVSLLVEEFKGKPLILFVKKDNSKAISIYEKVGFSLVEEMAHEWRMELLK